MTDYVNCPTCHGRGVIPLEEARRIEAHQTVTLSEQAAERACQEAESRRANLAATLERRKAEAERRLAAIKATVEVTSPPGPAELSRLQDRLASLQDQRDHGADEEES